MRDKIIKYSHSCKNEEVFRMSGYSNNVHTSLVLIIVILTLVAGPTITYLISPYNAKAAQFEIDKSQFKKHRNLLALLVT